MSSISHPSAAWYRCEEGDSCEFVKHLKHCKRLCADVEPSNQAVKPATEISKTSKLLIDIAQRGVWGGIGAVTNYLSGGDPIAGALFNPLTSELNKGLNFIVSKSPFNLKKDGSLTHIAQALTIKGTSMFVVASALNFLGYPVTNTTLIVNLIPRITLIALGIGFMKASNTLLAGLDGIEHMHYHKVPCPCPDRSPEIEQTEKFLKEYQDKIPADMSLLLQSNIESVKQAIANHKDIKEAKEKLAVQLKHVQKTTIHLNNEILLETSPS